MATTTVLSRFIVMKPHLSDVGYVSYMDKFDGVAGSVIKGIEGVFSMLVKIEVEPATSGDNYVHLRFFHTNKYWARNNAKDGYVVAQSNQPEEDTSKLSCTLFEPTFVDDSDNGVFYLTHVQSGLRVQMDPTSRISVREAKHPSDGYFSFVDWDTLVKLPNNDQHVAFKGDNGKYLKAFYATATYLQFSSDDANEVYSGHQVELMPDGHVRIKSLHSGKLWSRTTGFGGLTAITADTSDDDEGIDVDDTLFWPIKIDDNSIALRNKGNNNFCCRFTTEGVLLSDALFPSVPTITKEARLQVQEQVLERKIYNVRYRMEDARIFGETPFLAGTTTVFNESDQEASIDVSITYTDEKSYSFSRSVSVSAGITSTIETDALEIVKASIQVSYQITGTFEWNDTTTTSTSVMAQGGVPVPARTTAVVTYVGTKGTCSVPFSYVQQDKSSTDGHVSETQQIDGIYNGVNCYNFSFVVEKTLPL